MDTHQVARFSYERSIHRIGHYLKGTSNKVGIFRPNKVKGLVYYVDADFTGEWYKADTSNSEAVISKTGYVIKYTNCPVPWCSKLQSEIALSTTEVKYITLNQAIREVVSFMNLLREVNEIFPLNLMELKLHCKVFEDNISYIFIATSQKIPQALNML